MDTKHCSKCGLNKPLTDFSIRAKAKDGHRGTCRDCDNKRKARWARENPQNAEAARRRYINKDPQAFKAAAAKKAAAYRARNPDLAKKRQNAFYWSKVEHHRESALRYRQKNIEAARARDRLRAKLDPAWNRSKAARCRKQRPMSLTKDDMRELQFIYRCCVAWSDITGVKHHVDHIVPLKGRNVSGLHVPWNLRIVPAKDNLKKGNRLDLCITMP